MSKLRIQGDTSGYVDIIAPDVAGTTSLDLGQVPQKNQTTVFTQNVGIGSVTNPTNTYGPTLHIQGSNPNLRLDGTGSGSWAWISMNTADSGDSRAMGTASSGDFRITNIRDNLDSGIQFNITQSGYITAPYQPCCSVGYTAGAKTSAGAILFNNVYVNNGGHYNSANGRFTAPVAGHYKIDASALSNSGTTHGFRLCLNGNGVYSIENTDTNVSNYTQASGTAIFYCNAGDFLTVEWKNGSIYGGGGDYTMMNVMLIG